MNTSQYSQLMQDFVFERLGYSVQLSSTEKAKFGWNSQLDEVGLLRIFIHPACTGDRDYIVSLECKVAVLSAEEDLLTQIDNVVGRLKKGVSHSKNAFQEKLLIDAIRATVVRIPSELVANADIRHTCSSMIPMQHICLIRRMNELSSGEYAEHWKFTPARLAGASRAARRAFGLFCGRIGLGGSNSSLLLDTACSETNIVADDLLRLFDQFVHEYGFNSGLANKWLEHLLPETSSSQEKTAED